MKPVVFDSRGVKFTVEQGNAVFVDRNGVISFDEAVGDSINWPTPIEVKSVMGKKKVLGGLMRGDVARDITPENLPLGVVRQVRANCDSTIRNAAYRYDMKLKIKAVNKSLFNVERV